MAVDGTYRWKCQREAAYGTVGEKKSSGLEAKIWKSRAYRCYLKPWE